MDRKSWIILIGFLLVVTLAKCTDAGQAVTQLLFSFMWI